MKKEALLVLVFIVLVPTVFADHLGDVSSSTIDTRYEDPAHLELNHLLFGDNLEKVNDLAFVRQDVLQQALKQKFGIIPANVTSPSTLKQTDITLESVDFTIGQAGAVFVFENTVALDENEDLIQIEGNTGDSFSIVYSQDIVEITVNGANAFIGNELGFIMTFSQFDSAVPGKLTLSNDGQVQTVDGENIVFEDEAGFVEGTISFQRGIGIDEPVVAPEPVVEPVVEPEVIPEPVVESVPLPQPIPEPKPQRPDIVLTQEEFVFETLQLELKFDDIPQTLIEERIQRLQNTLEHVKLEREIKREPGRTTVILTITPDRGFLKRTLAEDYTLYDRIPKCFGGLTEIVFEVEPTEILDEDPAYKNTFTELSTQTTFQYYVNSEVAEECDRFFAAIGISDNIKTLGLTDAIALKGLGSAVKEFRSELSLFLLLFLGLVAVGWLAAKAKGAAK